MKLKKKDLSLDVVSLKSETPLQIFSKMGEGLEILPFVYYFY